MLLLKSIRRHHFRSLRNWQARLYRVFVDWTGYLQIQQVEDKLDRGTHWALNEFSDLRFQLQTIQFQFVNTEQKGDFLKGIFISQIRIMRSNHDSSNRSNLTQPTVSSAHTSKKTFLNVRVDGAAEPYTKNLSSKRWPWPAALIRLSIIQKPKGSEPKRRR
jgi:hypothetical protein